MPLGWDEPAALDGGEASVRDDGEVGAGVRRALRTLPGHRRAEVLSTSMSQAEVDALADSLEPVDGGTGLDWTVERPGSTVRQERLADAVESYTLEAHDGSRSGPGITRATSVDISVMSSSPRALDIVEQSNPPGSIEIVDVDGHRAHRYDPVGQPKADFQLVRWVVDGSVVSVMTRGLSPTEALAIARGLRAVPEPEWGATFSAALANGLDPYGSSASRRDGPSPLEGTFVDGEPWSVHAVGHATPSEVTLTLDSPSGSATGTVDLAPARTVVATAVRSSTGRDVVVIGWTTAPLGSVRVVDSEGTEHEVRSVPMVGETHGSAFVLAANADELPGPLQVTAGEATVTPTTVRIDP